MTASLRTRVPAGALPQPLDLSRMLEDRQDLGKMVGEPWKHLTGFPVPGPVGSKEGQPQAMDSREQTPQVESHWFITHGTLSKVLGPDTKQQARRGLPRKYEDTWSPKLQSCHQGAESHPKAGEEQTRRPEEQMRNKQKTETRQELPGQEK